MTSYTRYQSPIGNLLLNSCGNQLTGLWIEGEKHAPVIEADWEVQEAPFMTLLRQLDAYFAGKLKTFDVVATAVAGTVFQRQVWQALCQIPYGTTISYAELARRIANPKAVRAVGLANGKNPISIVVPCHRVIGANGSLTGYGGGLTAKKWLLEHEARHC